MNIQERVKEILKSQPMYLDTETTGFDRTAQIVELAVIDYDGSVLLDTLIKPPINIPAAATNVHGITDEDVAGAPTFRDVLLRLQSIMGARVVVIYNADYDLRMLRQSAAEPGLGQWSVPVDFSNVLTNTHCAMLLYAEFWGDYNSYRHSYKWQSLVNAARQQRLILPPNLHRALADARLTRSLMLKMGRTS